MGYRTRIATLRMMSVAMTSLGMMAVLTACGGGSDDDDVSSASEKPSKSDDDKASGSKDDEASDDEASKDDTKDDAAEDDLSPDERDEQQADDSDETNGPSAFETPVGDEPDPKPDSDDGGSSEGDAAADGDLTDEELEAAGGQSADGETNGEGAFETPVGGVDDDLGPPNPPEGGGATPPDAGAELTPEQGGTGDDPPTDQSMVDDDGFTGGASEPVAMHDSCEECMADLCAEHWALCEDEPLCSGALGCLGSECGPSPSSECALACFDGDVDLALTTFQLYACANTQCTALCGPD